MTDFRENYFEAREIVAQELKEKYNLIESYKDDNRLTLDSSKHSIHLTFYLPDGKGLNITKKGNLPDSNYSFLAYVFKLNSNDLEKTQTVLKDIFKSMKNIDETELHSRNALIESYQLEILFLNNNFHNLFI